jgi:hypothetical protein
MKDSDQKPIDNYSSPAMETTQAGGFEPHTVLLNPTASTTLAGKNDSKLRKFTIVTTALIVELIIPLLCVLCTCAVSVLYSIM